MNTATHSNSDTVTHITPPGPGSLLKDARESAGLSLRDVAGKLHLDLNVVISLESDDFSSLPAATFVRGYLRSYTQLLGLPVGPVLEALDNKHLSPPVLIADIADTPQARSDDMPVRLASYGVIAALTILVVLWWHNQDFDYREYLQPKGEIEAVDTDATTALPPIADIISPQQSQQPFTVNSETTTTQTAPLGSESSDEIASVVVQNTDTTGTLLTPESSPGDESETPAAITEGPDIAPQDADSLAQQLAEAQDSIEASRQVLNQNQSLVDPQPATESELNEVSNTPTQDQTTATTPPAQTVVSSAAPGITGGTLSATSTVPEDTLSIHFTRESWVTVYDNNDNRLFYNLTRPDQTLEVRGPGPLRVLLGRPRGVTMLYNGKPMDIKPHISSSGIARFTGNP